MKTVALRVKIPTRIKKEQQEEQQADQQTIRQDGPQTIRQDARLAAGKDLPQSRQRVKT